MGVTRKDVAKLAGVSETTVSFVLSGKRYVSEDLVRKVNSAVKQLNYHPDMIAKTMRGKKTHSIAILIKDFTNPLHMQMIQSIENSAMNSGYFVNICGGNMFLDRYVNEFISRRVDGVFVIANAENLMSENICLMLDNGISLAFGSFDSILDDRICGIAIDFVKGMEDIVLYLKENGHSKIAYFSLYESRKNDLRLDGFRQAMVKHFGNSDPVTFSYNGKDESSMRVGYRLAEQFISDGNDCTAVVCMNDMVAMGVITAFKDHGISVPQDISVVGIDDISFAGEYAGGLTTLSHKADLFGKTVFEVLKNNILDKTNVGRVVIEPELIVRTTTRKI